MDTRSQALQRIAALSARSPSSKAASSFTELFEAAQPRRVPKPEVNGEDVVVVGDASGLGHAPMGIEELQVLLALCKAAPQISSLHSAQQFVRQSAPYLLEAPTQVIESSPFIRTIEPSPWEALSYSLVSALLAVGIRHAELQGEIYNCILGYIDGCSRASAAQEAVHSPDAEELSHQSSLQIAAVGLSILGFLGGAVPHWNFFGRPQQVEVVRRLHAVLSEGFLVSLEGAMSLIRTSPSTDKADRDWKYLTRRYASSGRPFGAMLLQQGFMRLLVCCGALQVVSVETLQSHDVLEALLAQKRPHTNLRRDEYGAMTELLADLTAEEMGLLEDGADYLQLGSSWQQRVAFSTKGQALIAFLCCMLTDEDIADLDLLMVWLDDAISDPVQMADPELSGIVLRCLAIVAKASPATATSLARSLPRFIVQGGLRGHSVDIAAQSLAMILRLLSQDAMITGLYTLGNVLSANSSQLANGNGNANKDWTSPKIAQRFTQHATGSSITLDVSGEEETTAVYGNVVQAVVEVAISSSDSKMIPLALSMLLQKLGKISSAVDLQIIVECARLAARGDEADLRSLLKIYDRLGHEALINGNSVLSEAIVTAQISLAHEIPTMSPLSHLYLLHLLETIISKGDLHEGDNTHDDDVELATNEIALLIKPLAILTALRLQARTQDDDIQLITLQRNAWFNIAVHSIIPGTAIYQKHLDELKLLAVNSKPLIDESAPDPGENEIDLNVVLRRGMNGAHTSEMRKKLAKLLPNHEDNVRALTYPKIIFLLTAYMLETLRADSGRCAAVLDYFVAPSINRDEPALCMKAIADEVLGLYLRRALTGRHSETAAPCAARELALILARCCHRIYQCQQVAMSFAEKLTIQMPSSLCQKTSLFVLLEVLTLMWKSCLESEVDEYQWRSDYASTLVNLTLRLSDDFAYRRKTLNSFHARAKNWVTRVINIAPLDVKGILQSYLAAYEDEGAYGHIELGRSFAMEMGSAIPKADHKLGALEIQDNYSINTGSDFIAQYTTRQEYKYADPLSEYDQEWTRLLQLDGQVNGAAGLPDRDSEDAHAILAVLERRLAESKFIAMKELRDVLRRAASLLCRSSRDQCAILRQLVGIPFRLFNKPAINLGISLWLGIINENPHMESGILTEIAGNWEETVKRKRGIFSPSFQYQDPFFIKEEYAPSDKKLLLKRQQTAHNLIAPHLRILLFLSSHYNACRLGTPQLRRIFQKVVNTTLDGLEQYCCHPLAREFHFQVILLALTFLRHSDDLGAAIKWRLKESILSAGLRWFSFPRRWSFGGNRLQLKAECQLYVDIEAALHTVWNIGSTTSGPLQALGSRQDLLVHLIEEELTRLQVWLYPVENTKQHRLPHRHSASQSIGSISSSLVDTAWAVHPRLALQLAIRFQDPKLTHHVLRLLSRQPIRALDAADAIRIVFQDGMRRDSPFPMKYLLYWAPVNPITAVTYFLPKYGNHPYLLQYAVRSLESHSVDVTFFYVPQIVQTLRYDALGYVQRYIVETAKSSQLFAHQIIWNMKANAYKDEEATVEDDIKRALDKVTENMLSSFTNADREFYDREFAFFDEVTSISGKLRPFIKEEKPVKKAKIEEELRKIKVDVGVYLPSNPDGVVVGIDRKSGKPLQSHAKAPFMATFRIRKNKGDIEGTENMLETTNQNAASAKNEIVNGDDTYEVWQSAIFKVGDDCRQDVLALQLIAAFRGIWNHVGLDVYVFPYRVTATAPGCGVIDVLPNSISRDMLGREAVNGLYEYFVSKYGGEESIPFQEARNNFVKSMAAYSIISYLLQFKDRHNGNIMVDDAGHILHIDFGFCFDIAPGGIKFERAPFKLTSEMVAVMGRSTHSQSFRWFEELCVKAFLASRTYVDQLCHMILAMLDSGLPCFKPTTVQHLRERFVLEKDERQAAEFVRMLVRRSNGSQSTKVYDEFQLLTNGIPY